MRTLFVVVVGCLVGCTGGADAEPTGDPSPTADTGTPGTTSSSTVTDEPLAASYQLPDDAGFPEGIAYRTPDRSFYMGSLEHGSLQRLTAGGELSRVFVPEDGWTSLGVKVHPDTGDVLACAVRDPSTPAATSELWVHRPDDGSTERIPLQGDPSNCNDLAIDGDVVYLTDREAPNVHRVDLARGSAELWLSDDELTPQIIGNNGLTLTEDGEALLLTQFAPPRLLRVPLDGGSVTEVSLGGDSLGFLPNGADGMAWVDGHLIIAAHAAVARVASLDGWQTATVWADDTPVDIVAVTDGEGALYGLNGEVIPFVLGGDAELPFEVVELPIPGL